MWVETAVGGFGLNFLGSQFVGCRRTIEHDLSHSLYLDMSWSALSDRLLSLRKFCAGSLWDRMMWLGWHGGSHRKASHLHADDGGFASRSRCGSITSCSHPCASVTEQYNLVPAKDGDALWQASWNGSFSQLWVDRQGRWSIVAVPLTVLHVSILMVRNLLSLSFNGHFPGGSRLADTRKSLFWILLELRLMEMVVTTGAIRRAKHQSKCHRLQTNTQFLQAGCPSCSAHKNMQLLLYARISYGKIGRLMPVQFMPS